MPQRWEFELDGARQVVQLGEWGAFKGEPRVFLSEGVQHSLGGPVHRGPRTAMFDIAGHPASMTMRQVAAGRATYKRSFGSRLRRLPATILGYILGGARRRGGAAGGAAGSSMLAWAIYELRVDGASRGSWVAKVVAGRLKSWVYADPGKPLPEPDWPDWPAPTRLNLG